MMVLCGKTATGKDTLLNILCKSYGFKPIVSYTTRPMRDGETQNKEYRFISQEEFERMDADEEFAETTSYDVASGETWLYGSAKSDFVEADNRSIIIIQTVLNSLVKFLRLSQRLCWCCPTKMKHGIVFDSAEMIMRKLVDG